MVACKISCSSLLSRDFNDASKIIIAKQGEFVD